MILKLLSIFFSISLGFFTIASTILVLYSINNRYRLRHIRMSWRAGKLLGFPLFASIFLACSLILTASMFFSGFDDRLVTMISYIWLSVMWFMSSYLASKHYITDNGIVKNINEPAQTIAWYQIIDFVEQRIEKGVHYAFFYKEGVDDANIYMLQLFVPQKQHDAFKKIVSYKLEKRFEHDDISYQIEQEKKKDNKRS